MYNYKNYWLDQCVFAYGSKCKHGYVNLFKLICLMVCCVIGIIHSDVIMATFSNIKRILSRYQSAVSFQIDLFLTGKITQTNCQLVTSALEYLQTDRTHACLFSCPCASDDEGRIRTLMEAR